MSYAKKWLIGLGWALPYSIALFLWFEAFGHSLTFLDLILGFAAGYLCGRVKE